MKIIKKYKKKRVESDIPKMKNNKKKKKWNKLAYRTSIMFFKSK